MTKNIIIGSVLGALLAFIWTMVSWMVIPWHNHTFHHFTNETAVESVIKQNAPQSGIYVLPTMNMKKPEEAAGKPQVFASVYLPGFTTMLPSMIFQYLTSLVTLLIASLLLLQTRGLSYTGRVGFLFALGIACAVMANIPNWTWWHFSLEYTAVGFADAALHGLFSALVLAYFVNPDQH